MKFTKIISLALALILALSLAACSGNNTENDDVTDPSQSLAQDALTESNADNPQPPTDEESQNDEDNLEVSVPNEDLSLSSVLYDFSFTVEGDAITLPLTLEEFIAYGWEPSLGLTENMGSKVISAAGFVKNGKDVTVYLANMSDESLPIQECTVYGVSSYYYDDYMGDAENDSFAVIELPKGIVLGKTTIEEVFNAFGGPTSAFYTNDAESKQTIVYSYDSEDFRGETRGIAFGVEIMTDIRKGNVITSIDICNVDEK